MPNWESHKVPLKGAVLSRYLDSLSWLATLTGCLSNSDALHFAVPGQGRVSPKTVNISESSKFKIINQTIASKNDQPDCLRATWIKFNSWISAYPTASDEYCARIGICISNRIQMREFAHDECVLRMSSIFEIFSFTFLSSRLKAFQWKVALRFLKAADRCDLLVTKSELSSIYSICIF